MNFTTAPLSWHWGIIFLVCLIGALSLGRTSRFYPLFWWPLVTLGGICFFTFFKSCGAGPKDGPSGLVVLFAVLPVTIVSTLGVITGIICLRKCPTADAAKPLPMSGGFVLSALALFLTTRSETRSLTVHVLDGNGKPVSGITVNAESSDEMTRKTAKQAVTDSNGVAYFKFWRFRTIEVSATARDCCLTRATYGQTGFGGKGWKLYSGNSSYMFHDRALDPTTIDLHLRGTDDFVLPDVLKRLVESLQNVRENDGKYALACQGASFENFEIMDQIKENPALHGSSATFLTKQAELLKECFEALDRELPREKRRFFRYEDSALKPSGWNGLARWAGIQGGDQLPRTPENLNIVNQHLCHLAEKLLDEAKPMLGEEDSTAGTYGELRFIAKHRLIDLINAYRAATPRAKTMILGALKDLNAGYSHLEPLVLASQPLEAVQLLRLIKTFRNREEFERARTYFHELDAAPHPAPDTAAPHTFNYVEQAYEDTRRFFEEEEKRLESPPPNH